MENLNAEQIKNDMEHCINDDCDKCSVPFGNCQANLIESAISLIISQEQRIEAYRQELGEVRVALAEANKERQELTEENERLKKDNEYILMQHAFQRRPSGDCWNDVIEKAKADTVRKMQERLKAEIERFAVPKFTSKTKNPNFITKDVYIWFIDQIAKEMLEDTK